MLKFHQNVNLLKWSTNEISKHFAQIAFFPFTEDLQNQVK